MRTARKNPLLLALSTSVLFSAAATHVQGITKNDIFISVSSSHRSNCHDDGGVSRGRARVHQGVRGAVLRKPAYSFTSERHDHQRGGRRGYGQLACELQSERRRHADERFVDQVRSPPAA